MNQDFQSPALSSHQCVWSHRDGRWAGTEWSCAWLQKIPAPGCDALFAVGRTSASSHGLAESEDEFPAHPAARSARRYQPRQRRRVAQGSRHDGKLGRPHCAFPPLPHQGGSARTRRGPERCLRPHQGLRDRAPRQVVRRLRFVFSPDPQGSLPLAANSQSVPPARTGKLSSINSREDDYANADSRDHDAGAGSAA